MKICRDCYYFKKAWISPFTDEMAECMFLTDKDKTKVNLVTGKPVTKVLKYCETERQFNCGPEGRNFWPRYNGSLA